jgi:hypothetical protein
MLSQIASTKRSRSLIDISSTAESSILPILNPLFCQVSYLTFTDIVLTSF